MTVPIAPTDPERLVAQLGALAQVSRLGVVRLLARYQPYGLPAGDIARLLAVPHNTLSTHLALLERAGLVRSRREGRQVIFALDAHPCAALANDLSTAFALDKSVPGSLNAPPVIPGAVVAGHALRVLVLCTANSARSLIAEALINREGRGRFIAVSAGSRPAQAPHIEAIRLLNELGYDTSKLFAKDWAQFSAKDCTPFDFVITVCDTAREGPCPVWPGHPLSAHWGIADPAGVPVPAQRAAMLDAYRQLSVRVTSLVNLPVETMDLASLKAAMARIARMEGATELALLQAA